MLSASDFFNMGHRLEIFTDEKSAIKMMNAASTLKIESQIVGRVEAAHKKELKLTVGNREIIY